MGKITQAKPPAFTKERTPIRPALLFAAPLGDSVDAAACA